MSRPLSPYRLYLPVVCSCLAATLSLNASVIQLEHDWAALADPAGTIDATSRNGIVSGESAAFSKDGQYIVTTSKSDGRLDRYEDEHLTGGTAHLRLFDLEGRLIWDKARSRGPDDNNDGRPDDQPASGEDELEVAIFSPNDLYIAAAGDDKKIELWQARSLATGDMLSEPILVKTFPLGAGADSLSYSQSGDLLFAGTEEQGKIEVFRVQGDPATWQFMHKADHGGSGKNGVNSVDLSYDDFYVASAGTNQIARLWRLDLVRNSEDLITSVDMVRLAAMNEPTSTIREIRFEPKSDVNGTPSIRDEYVALTAEHDQATRIYLLQDLLDSGTSNSSPPPFQTLYNFNTSIVEGNPVEPMTFSPDGRFLLTPGKTRGSVLPAFLRFYEVAEIAPGLPEPDPVYVRTNRVRNPEYFDFNFDGSLLTTSHHDGSVRLWNVLVGGSETIHSEAFNEPTSSAGRWVLEGSQATTSGGNGFGSIDQVSQSTPFRGHRGSGYIAARHLQNSDHALTLNDTWNLAGFRNLQVQFAAAAATGEFDGEDHLRLKADTTGDGVFETLVAEFLPDNDGDLAWTLPAGSGRKLGHTFEDFHVDLDPLLTSAYNQSIRFRLELWNSSRREEIAFDSLRITGEPIPMDLDSDGDSYTDFEESIANTSPDDPNASPGANRSFTYTPGLGADFTYTMEGTIGRIYELRRSLDLVSGWETVDSSGPLTSHQNLTLQDPSPPSDKAFYSIRITFP